MSELHLIHGYLGSGKTTFSKQLERDLPAIRFTFDEWMTHFYGSNPPADKFSDYTALTLAFINDFWPRLVKFKIPIILDFGFWSRVARDEVRAKAETLGVAVILYKVTCSEEVALQRCLERNKTLQGSFEISENTFYILKKRFESLDIDEPFQLIDTTPQ